MLHPTQVPGVAQPVLPQRESVADPSTAASRPDSAAGPTDPDLKGFFAIPGTDTVIRIGGYAKLDAIADSRAAGDEDQFIPSSMPVGGSHRDVSNFNIHAKQTRFSFEARRPTTHGNLRFYLENDFFGSSEGMSSACDTPMGSLATPMPAMATPASWTRTACRTHWISQAWRCRIPAGGGHPPQLCDRQGQHPDRRR